MINPETPSDQLQHLHGKGVRGVRFMIVPGSGGALGWHALEDIAGPIADQGRVINLQLDGRELPWYEARLGRCLAS